ncbi:hypothetical protein CXG81DRAFT_17347 [Caulochytrium protostelioides]|uniref:SAM-dependent MTase RsmB/NOP-type domain-containing protein n=1 Tax=Caulochytrium protostelioides TaxID=1555241 RepID=A0A4P9XCF3_9FUNG|nr:hypothetical protein CXG81DRAFT_17347 [Caulochytrium protostelioides]|eukprot:RKP03092.1 hypothetical protein CXG81DRAFT_17347 [Caulochytrium protostelioides]
MERDTAVIEAVSAALTGSTVAGSYADNATLYATRLDPSRFPASFVQFLYENQVDPSVYDLQQPLPRYVRWVTSSGFKSKGHAAPARAPMLQSISAASLGSDLCMDVTGDQAQLAFHKSVVGDLQHLDHDPARQLAALHASGLPSARPTWLPGIYALDPAQGLASNVLYKAGHLCGLDIASGAALAALDAQPGDHVLDLCCAPGAKMCWLIEHVSGVPGNPSFRLPSKPSDPLPGTVTGVDISEHRLTISRGLLRKFHPQAPARLYHADGTTFRVGAPARVGPALRPMADAAASSPEPPMRPFHASKLVRGSPTDFSGIYGSAVFLYDRVIVDAECTHDASLVHLVKQQAGDWVDVARFMDPQRLASLAQLQYALLENGFRLLKPGGVLVYSTCSFARAQNEDIVARLLAAYPDTARLEAVPGAEAWPVAPRPPRSPSLSPTRDAALQAVDAMTLRFTPRHSQTSGFFLARLRKVADEDDEDDNFRLSHSPPKRQCRF